MTSVTMRTFPSPQIAYLSAVIMTPAEDNDTSIFDLVTYLVSQFPYLESKNFSGYSFLQTNIADPVWNSSTGLPPPLVNVYLLVMALQDTQDPAAVDVVWNPIFAHVNVSWPRASVMKQIRTYPSFAAWFAENKDKNPTGADHWSGSRLVDAATLQGNATALRDALEAMTLGDGYVLPFLLGGRGVWNAKPRGGDDSVVPVWRKAVAHISMCPLRYLPKCFPRVRYDCLRGWGVLATGFDFQPLNATARALSIAMMEKKLSPIRALTPHMGAYMNEVGTPLLLESDYTSKERVNAKQADTFEPDFQRQFWGDNYHRLLRIKREVDPDDVLWCTPCVGNERWLEIDGRLCRR